MKVQIKAAAAGFAVAGALAATMVGGTGAASAAPSAAYPLGNCLNLSPNVVDLPYNPTRVIVADYAGKSYLTTEFSSLWGYQSRVRLDLRNQATGRHIVKFFDRRVSPPYVGTHVFTFPTSQIGKGRVTAVLTSANSNPVWTVPPKSCSGVIVIR